MLYRRDLVRASLVAVNISPISPVFQNDSLLNSVHIRSEICELATMLGAKRGGGRHAGNKQPTLVLFSYGAWLSLSGYMNSESSRHQCLNNSVLIEEEPLYNVMLGVWCAMSATMITGPFFLMKL